MIAVSPSGNVSMLGPDPAGAGTRIHHVLEPTIREFTDDVIDALMNGRLECNWWFALGFAAAVNAMSKDSIDFAQPVLTIEQAQADLEEVRVARARVTDALRWYCGRAAS